MSRSKEDRYKGDPAFNEKTSWRLKDRSLSETLDSLAEPEEEKFSELLPVFAKDPKNWHGNYLTVKFGTQISSDVYKHHIHIKRGDLEEFADYTDEGWNHWPETEPEECVLMEVREDGDDDHHSFLFYLSGTWYYAMGSSCIAMNEKKFRFRPAILFFKERENHKRI